MATRSILRLTVPQPCQNCRNMTVLVCDQCNTLVKLTDNRTFATYYCSQGCAAEDFPNHQAKCRRYRDRGLLYRAATVSQTLFMLTRTAAFDTLITHSEKDRDKAGRLVVHKGDVEAGTVLPFPNEKFKDETEQELMLAWRAGKIATARFSKFLSDCLDGIVEELEEIRFEVPKGNKYVVVRKANSEEELNNQHAMFRVRLKHDDTLYAVDLGGCLFGLTDLPMVKWSEYRGKVVMKDGKYEAKPIGWHLSKEHKLLKDRYANLKADKRYKSTNEEIDTLARSYVTDRIYLAVEEWVENDRDLTMAQVIEKVDDEWVLTFVEEILKIVTDFVNYLEVSGGIVALDQRVHGSRDIKSEQSPTFSDEKGNPVRLPKGLMSAFHQKGSTLWA